MLEALNSACKEILKEKTGTNRSYWTTWKWQKHAWQRAKT